jgi:hypothetical protein
VVLVQLVVHGEEVVALHDDVAAAKIDALARPNARLFLEDTL